MGGGVESGKWEGVSSYQLSVNGNHRPRMSHECSNGQDVFVYSCKIRGWFLF